MDEYVRFDEIYDTVLLDHLETMFRKSYRDGWKITALVYNPKDKKWLAKWSRDLTQPKPTPINQQNT